MADFSVDVSRIVEQAGKKWHTRSALVLTQILFFSITTVIIVVIDPDAYLKFCIYGGVVILIWLTWWHTNRLPRAKKNKVGFVISIATENESQQSKIRDDFILTLHELLKVGISGQRFQVITVPEHIARKIVDQDDAQELRFKCRAHFVVYGRVRLRTISGKEIHVIHLEGLVTHKPVPKNISEGLSREFTELMPRQLNIATEGDIFSFAFTSEWLNCVARYIIGIAAVCSGDIDYAEQLQKDVLFLLTGKDHSFPVYAKLKKRVPLRLAEISHARAQLAHKRWLTTRDSADMAIVRHHLDSIPASHSEEYGVLMLKSICLFVQDCDVNGALAALKKCKGNGDGTWLYNTAFLLAYKENLQGAIRQYRNALKQRVVESILAEVQDFMYWLLKQEPNKYQLYYCLGFLNWKGKGETSQALLDFQSFLSAGDQSKFPKERELAKQWMQEIQQTLDETDSGKGKD